MHGHKPLHVQLPADREAEMKEPVKCGTPDRESCTCRSWFIWWLWKFVTTEPEMIPQAEIFLCSTWLKDETTAVNVVFEEKGQGLRTKDTSHVVSTVQWRKMMENRRIQNIVWRTPMSSNVNSASQIGGFLLSNPPLDLWVMPVVLTTTKRHVFIVSLSSFFACWKSGWRADAVVGNWGLPARRSWIWFLTQDLSVRASQHWDMHVRKISDSKLLVGVNACVSVNMTVVWLTAVSSGFSQGHPVRWKMDELESNGLE